MTKFIILTPEQAAAAAVETTPGHVLRPVSLADGRAFVLPMEVLEDPAHAALHGFLSGLPAREVATEEFRQTEGG